MKLRVKNNRNADARRLRFETLETRRLLAVDLPPTNPEFVDVDAAVVATSETTPATPDWFVLA